MTPSPTRDLGGPKLPAPQTTTTEVTSLSARELARRIRARELTSRAVVEAHIARIERLDARVNAVVTRNFEDARRSADAVDRMLANRGATEVLPPLFGVPLTVKDSYATAGLRTTFAMPRMLDHTPSADAELVRRVKAAGAIILGKTNVPLGAFDWQCKHPSFGRTNNPWDLGRTPGGSSGGSAAALAAGFTPLELGSDVAGSIRVPAHFCGVVGLRPTEGALSGDGHAKIPGYADTVKSLVVCGPMARSAGDVRLLHEVLWDPELAARGGAPRASRRPPEATKPRSLRIGWSTSWGQQPIDLATRHAISSTLEELRRAGHDVREASPSALDPEEATAIWGLILGHEMIGAPSWIVRSAPMRLLYAMNPLRMVFGRGSFARSLSAGFASSRATYERALARRVELIDTMDAFLSGMDAWLTPATSTAAFTHRTIGSDLVVDGESLSYADANGPWQVPSATYAHPCVSLPAGTSPEGLPIGVQLHARRWSDFALLDAAAVIEALVDRPSGLVATLSAEAA